ncbi:MAG: glutamate transport system ATP-binding protein, partial [Actinomycetota bacterium]|nr:glutamate transport system ATP-binding protein [Actinomycetota bacterium]
MTDPAPPPPGGPTPPPAAGPSAAAGPSDGTTALVVVDKVNKFFGDLHVLHDIDLTVGRGEVLVVVGPSGSGKSTLIRCINRLERVTSGTITIDG